ncbi:MAG: response regulator [Tannerella sp.]|jgi:signal transduction histidine kinase/ligand-binding sensor domain-containing protein/CheY-like chemotaxis protein/AraC-like DNA-binding protein|nr:response regulator [Tannerella sp.]
MKFRLLFAFIAISTWVSYSAPVKFYNINSLHGISLRETASICQDQNGFVWASSKTGILRLTDDDYRIYQLPYETIDVIFTRLIYENSVLLAYSNNGQVFRYNVLCDRFDLLFNMKNLLNHNYLGVANILVDSPDVYWIASTVGLYRYQAGELTLIGDDPAEATYITRYDDSHIVMAKAKGIGLVNRRTLQTTYVYEKTASFSVSKLFYDKAKDRLWIGTVSNGLFYYDFTRNSFAKLPISSFPKQPIQAIEANSDSTLLVGIDGQGIWELNKSGNRVLNIYKESADDPFSLRGNGVYALFCDQNRRVWVCTISGGVSFFEQSTPIVTQIIHQVNNHNSLSNNDVNKIVEDSRGNLWFATNNGISCWDVKADRWRTFYQNEQEQAQVFLSLCEDDRGRIWAGAYSSGVYVIDGISGRELAHYSTENSHTPLANDFVFDIFPDNQGNLWIGGNGEIACYMSEENRLKGYVAQPVAAFAELSTGQILLACSYGLCLLDKESGDTQILADGFLLQDILVLHDDVWMCTDGDGLVRYNLKDKTVEKFTTQSGLPSNYVKSIMQADGYLWAGTENGLFRFDPKDKTVFTYSSLFPLSNISFNLNSHCRLRNGQLAFGTNNGIILFDPATLEQTRLHGQIFFQDLIISGRSIRDSSVLKPNSPLDSLQEISLNYTQNALSLELLPIGRALAGSKFSWKMEGLDTEWNTPSSHRIVTYTNMPSGDFRLKIRLYDSSLSQVIAEREIQIHLIPPFWKTRWFRLLLFILVIGIVYFSLRFYIDRLKQRHTEDKIRFFTNTAHDIRTSLTLIKAPIEELNKEPGLTERGKHYLHLATEQVRRLSSVATQLLDFQKVDIGKGQLSLVMVDLVVLIVQRRIMFESFAMSKNIALRFDTELETCQTAIDEAMIEKVIDNLISNAVKYSHSDGEVQIGLQCGAGNWTLEVRDQGIGINRKAQSKLFREFYRSDNAVNSKIVGSGIGLLLSKNYIALHGGSISCSSQENVGSTFKVVVPFKEVVATRSVPGAREALAIEPEVASQQTPQGGEGTKDMRILIVEDNDDLRNFMLYPLGETFDVLTAEDGVFAWELIQKQMPDLVVSDVMMPNMDGFELCRLMKSTYETSHIPVVLLTALTEKAEQLHGLGLGADDYLTKPFDMTLLSQRIKSIINNRKIIREKALKLIKGGSDEPVLSNELNDKFVKKALEVVRANIDNPEFGKDEFASAMNASSSLLYKKIKALTDQSPVDFIKAIRLNHALTLLQSHKYTVTEISEMCGFSSVGYFSTTFRKYFGKSPTEI